MSATAAQLAVSGSWLVGSSSVNVDMIDLLGDATCDARSSIHRLRLCRRDSDRCAYTCCTTEQQVDQIAVGPDIVGGQAHVRGTRIAVSVVLDRLAAGSSEDEIVEPDDDRMVITLDRGVGDIRSFPPGGHPGVVVLRPVSQDPVSILTLIDRLPDVQ